MALQEIPKITKYLSVVLLFAWLGRSTVWNFLPVYFQLHIDQVFLIGVLTSLPAFVSLMLDIPVSNYVQRVGEKFVFFTGLIFGIMPAAAYILATPAFLFAGKLFEGVTKSLIWNSGWSLSMKSSDEETESESLSVFTLGVNLSTILGPILGGYLILAHGFQIVFLLWILTSAIAVPVFASYIGTSAKANRVKMMEKLFESKTYSNDIKHLKNNWSHVKDAYALVFLSSIIASFFWLAVPLMLEEMGATYAEMGLIFGFAALPSAFQILFGDLADKIGRLKTVLLLASLLTPLLLLMAYVESIVLVGILFFFASALTLGMSPAIHSIFDKNAPEEVESELVGFMESFKHTGALVGPLMAGAVASLFSLAASFASAAFISLLILLYSIKIYKF